MSDRTAPRDRRQVHVPAPPVTNGSAGQPGSRRSPAARGRTVAPAAKPAAKPAARPPRAPAAKAAPARRRGRRPWRRRLLLLAPLLLVLAALGGFAWATSIFNRIEKVPVGDVLSTGGSGTNYLLVGADTRDPARIIDAGLNPEAFQGGGGDRSDTMVLLRFDGGQARMLSIPRDLYVPIAETGGSQKINAAFNGGPRRLVLTIQQSLGVPVHHYVEVDFVSFASVVDALGGVTIEFEHPAFDRMSGLSVDRAGPVELDGPQALAYARSRQYTEVIDGRHRTDPTADLGRIERQQTFLSAVFSELGSSRNPFTLAQVASGASAGLRIDDRMGLLDAMRLGWRLRSLDPERFQLPVRHGSNHAGSVLFLEEQPAEMVLGLFR